MRDAALVVGASGGIGGACVRRLVSDHRIALAASRSKPDEDLLAFDRVRWAGADITTVAGRETIVDLVEQARVPLASVVVASGVAHRGPLLTQTEDEWHATLAANVVGPALLLSELAARATWTTPAAIALIGSLSARRALPDRSLYGASKSALEQFGRSIAVELAPRGIAVNVVSVGVTDTPFLSGDRERLERYTRDRIPVGHMANPDEVAEAVAFALIGGSLTGATIELDGGAGVLG